MKEELFESFDGTLLNKYTFECKSPKAIVQIAHGMQEYCATYFEFASFLADNGFLVVMFDQRGHGKSVAFEDIGKVNKEVKKDTPLPTDYDMNSIKNDIFTQTLIDQIYLSKKLKNQYDLPLYFVGHSYGSFIGQAYLEECPTADKIVLIGTGYMKKPSVVLGKCVADISKTFRGLDANAKLIEKLSFDSYKKKFATGSWITSDEAETQKFYADKKNGSVFSNGFYASMFKNQLKHPCIKKLDVVEKQRPILLVSGDQDVIGDMGQGVKKLHQIYLQCGLNAKIKLYKNKRHAILQEDNKQQVFADILDFLQD